MGKRNNSNTTTSDESAPSMDTESEQKKPTVYVVVREGFRVSDKEYDNPKDPACRNEVEFWTKVSKNHSYSEKVEAVVYDSKKHRIW